MEGTLKYYPSILLETLKKAAPYACFIYMFCIEIYVTALVSSALFYISYSWNGYWTFI